MKSDTAPKPMCSLPETTVIKAKIAVETIKINNLFCFILAHKTRRERLKYLNRLVSVQAWHLLTVDVCYPTMYYCYYFCYYYYFFIYSYIKKSVKISYSNILFFFFFATKTHQKFLTFSEERVVLYYQIQEPENSGWGIPNKTVTP